MLNISFLKITENIFLTNWPIPFYYHVGVVQGNVPMADACSLLPDGHSTVARQRERRFLDVIHMNRMFQLISLRRFILSCTVCHEWTMTSWGNIEQHLYIGQHIFVVLRSYRTTCFCSIKGAKVISLSNKIHKTVTRTDCNNAKVLCHARLYASYAQHNRH